MRRRNKCTPYWTALVALTLGALSGCGSEGTSPAPSPTPTPPPVAKTNVAPAFTSSTAVNVVENVTGAIYQAAAADADGDAISFSIRGGADASRFTLTASGQLAFVAPPNFDLAGDSDANNDYEVQIGVKDGQATATLNLTVTVANSREGISVRRVATGFTSPASVWPVSATTLLVAERAGAIYLLNLATNTRSLLLQLSLARLGGSISSIAAAPTFASDGRFYLMYAGPVDLIVEGYSRSASGATVADASGPLIKQDATTYRGGWLGFDAGGRLLAATGIGNNDQTNRFRAQDPNNKLGKLLRFSAVPTNGAELLALGLFQPNGGTLFNGQLILPDKAASQFEEINLLAFDGAQRNYGFPYKDGTEPFRPTATMPTDLIDPVLQYPVRVGGQGPGVIGGGIGPSTIASLRGQYVFGDESGSIFTVDPLTFRLGTTLTASSIEHRDADFTPDVGTINSPVAIISGPADTLYIVDSDGEVFKVEAG